MRRILHYTLQLKNTGYSIALLALAVLLYLLIAKFPLHADITRNGGNSLSTSSVDILKQLHGPLDIIMYTNSKDAELGDIEQWVRDFISRYRRYKPDISLRFIDPVKNPEAIRNANIQARREMAVTYNGRTEHLTMLNEQALSSALLRLAHSRQQMLMYVDGHGERKLDGQANFDLGQFGEKLKQNGYRITSLNLAVAQDVPANGSILIITQPRIDLLPGEVQKIERYVDGGGNLLWLLDAEPLHGLEKLASQLGLLLAPGKIIDPDAQKLNAPENWTIGASYPPHPVTRNFNLVTVFPDARAIGADEAGREDSTGGRTNGDARKIWQHNTLIEAAGNGWVSRNPVPRAMHFEKGRDIPGPFSLAMALQRSVNDREQRIIVVGSGAFLANAYAGNGGNLDLGINMVNWLAGEEHLITTQPRATLDSSIQLGRNQLIAISYGLAVILPLLLAGIGGWTWWRRRN